MPGIASVNGKLRITGSRRILYNDRPQVVITINRLLDVHTYDGRR